jgi:serine palmitoyltransferase
MSFILQRANSTSRRGENGVEESKARDEKIHNIKPSLNRKEGGPCLSVFADVAPLVGKGTENYSYTIDPSNHIFDGTTVAAKYSSKVTNEETCFRSKQEQESKNNNNDMKKRSANKGVVGLENEYEPYDYSKEPHSADPEITAWATLTTYFAYAIIIFFGHVRDFIGKRTNRSRYFSNNDEEKGFSPIVMGWENFYTRRLYHRIQDCWNRPITSEPGSLIDVVVRKSKDGNKTLEWKQQNETHDKEKENETVVETRKCINLGSYNYLGFGDDWKNTCKEFVWPVFEDFPINTLSSRVDIGTTTLHKELEETVAKFVGKEAAICYNMGYGTNSTTIPALVGKGCLLISDALNHTSIVNGSRASGASIRAFKHNCEKDLEDVIRESIAGGQPRTRRPWRKILVMIEGIYSMEGEICNLKKIVQVCKKYGVYVYVDEAHSIGALGATGRGVCEQTGVDPADIDILMGTFTKSFGGMGGYIAGSSKLVNYLRKTSAGAVYHNSLSTVVCKQCIVSLKIMMGLDGSNVGQTKIKNLKANCNYFRKKLMEMGLHIYGDYDSPVIPVMIYNPTKIAAFSRECYDRGLAMVVVGFPATPIILSRSRVCVSAAHTKEQLDYALEKIKEVTDLLDMRYKKHFF